MSKVLEKSFGGILNSLIGSSSSFSNTLLDSCNVSSGISNVSFGLMSFVERLEAGRKISKQEEEDIVKNEYQEWLHQTSKQNIKNEVIADYLCRSLITFSRGHFFSSLHIHAIKLTQSDKLLHKKTGYLYITRTMIPGSDLAVLLVNTIQRDLSSSHVIEVSLGLSLLPIVTPLDIIPVVSDSIVSCLNHQQPYIRRRAAVMAGSLLSQATESQSSFALLTPHLQKLLTDSDPAIVIAAIMTLSDAFKSLNGHLGDSSLQDEIAKGSAHILAQATDGSLPQHYNIGPINAPFVQVQMLRAIQNVSTSDWSVPAEVVNAVESVLSQPWGGRQLSLYMTLLEGITTVTSMPKNDILITQTLKILLGFLKSSSIDFKYLGIKFLSRVFSVLEDTLTESHLEAVLECLGSPNQLLQSRTIRLLCSMANKCNYQAICSTLKEFAFKTENSTTKDLVLNHLSNILKRISVDITWCADFVYPLLEPENVQKSFLDALKIAISKGIEDIHKGGMRTDILQQPTKDVKMLIIVSACHKLFSILMRNENVSLIKLNTVAFILNILFTVIPEAIETDVIDVFIEKAQNITVFEENCDDVLDCLLNCGLFIPGRIESAQRVLKSYILNNHIHTCLKSREKLLLLNDCDLTKKVLSKKKKIMEKDYLPDFTLSFYDSLVIKHLENGAQTYKPFTVKTRHSSRNLDKRAGSFNPFDVTGETSTQLSSEEKLSTSLSSKSSLCGTSSIIGTASKNRSIWTSKGRIKQKSGSSENDSDSMSSSCIEVAHEADENSIIESTAEIDKTSAATKFLESQKVDLTQALLKGLGLSKH